MRKERIKAQLEQVNKRLQLYYEAEAAILAGAQSYSIGSRNITRATLATVRDEIKELENRKDELERMLAGEGRRKSFRVIIRDL